MIHRARKMTKKAHAQLLFRAYVESKDKTDQLWREWMLAAGWLSRTWRFAGTEPTITLAVGPTKKRERK